MSQLRELYRPSCGSEGADFISSWCCGCERDKNQDCQIVADTFMYDTDEPEYPQQWVYGDNGPECTAWIALGDPLPTPRCAGTTDMFSEPGPGSETPQ